MSALSYWLSPKIYILRRVFPERFLLLTFSVQFVYEKKVWSVFHCCALLITYYTLVPQPSNVERILARFSYKWETGNSWCVFVDTHWNEDRQILSVREFFKCFNWISLLHVNLFGNETLVVVIPQCGRRVMSELSRKKRSSAGQTRVARVPYESAGIYD